VTQHEAALKAVGARLNAGPIDVVKKLDALLAHQKDLESKLKAFEQKAAAGLSDQLIASAVERDGLKFVVALVEAESPEALRNLGSQMLPQLGEGVVKLGAIFGDKATVVAFCSPAAIKAGHQAGRIVATIATAIGGKGGGKPDFAMGGGKETSQLAAALELK